MTPCSHSSDIRCKEENVMRKQLFVIVFLILAVSLIFCAPVSESQVRKVAQNISLERSGDVKAISSIGFLYQNEKTHIYLVN